MKESGVELDLMNCGRLAQNVSEERNFSMLLRDHSCETLMKNVAAFQLLSEESI